MGIPALVDLDTPPYPTTHLGNKLRPPIAIDWELGQPKGGQDHIAWNSVTGLYGKLKQVFDIAVRTRRIDSILERSNSATNANR